ncbi:MAG: EAL domain-containing protein [Lachnospiraceae bacterium]|nr:EAL domain-containing protein [Lachnospiraceae bacterium]
MPNRLFKSLFGTDLKPYKKEISEQNCMAIRYLAFTGIPVSIASIAAQTIIKGAPSLTLNGSLMLLYFILLAFTSSFLIPRNCPRATLLVYVFEAPVLLVSILLGTIWDPNHQALTYLMFMVVMPVFILDYLWRVLAVLSGWNLLFLILCFTVKDPSTRRGDLIHLLQFSLASAAVTIVVLKLRIDVIQSYESVRYHKEHDSLTGVRSRQSLEDVIRLCRNTPLTVIMGDLDQLSLINDFYGREAGDDLIISFASILQEYFGEDRVYRYGEDALLCLLPDNREETCRALIQSCRKKLASLSKTGQSPYTCAFSYVTGCPENPETLRKMIQLAEVQVHKAGKLSRNSTLGCAYDDATFRAGIVEANISTHLKVFETNQLTGLPGMEYFISRSEELLNTLISPDSHPVVGYLNLLHFQIFNDTFGYEQGDELARTLVKLLQETFPNRHLAYLSSGRFGILCYLEEAEEGIRSINQKLKDYKPGFSAEIKAGFVEYRPGDYMISLLDKAKLSHDNIYPSKDSFFRLYDEELDREREFRQYLVSHLDEAIEKDWIKVYYQPIVRPSSRRICNLEALSRWEDPRFGFLMPAKFISILEEERLIYKLNLHVIRQVLRDFKYLESHDLPLIPVSVNLSRRDFSECDMLRQVTSMMEEAEYPRSLLSIEITESAFVKNPDYLIGEIDRFHDAGFQIWMDDFGSEYSTLNLLNKMNFDLLKIDMQFMKNFSSSGRNRIIVEVILEMSRRLGITTLVEGVETQDQFDALLSLGCEKLQGFLFSRPVPLTAILDDIRAGRLYPPEQKGTA